jgi:integrase
MCIDKRIAERIFKALWMMRKEGLSETTIVGTSQRLKLLAKRVNLDNPEEVKEFIANQSWSPYFKNALSYAYDKYVKANGLEWKITIYKIPSKLPKIPTTETINMIIGKTRCLKHALCFSIMRDTGIRPIELHRLTLKDIDLEKGILYPKTSKRGCGRALKIKTKTLAMLKHYVSINNFELSDKLFPKPHLMKMAWIRARNKLAQQLKDPQIKTIRLYDLRHYFATMLYHKTKNIMYVKQQLGHKDIKTTLIYTQLIDFKDEEFHVAVARNLKEACQLIEQGFEYVTEMDGAKIFRKRK